jgi:transposase
MALGRRKAERQQPLFVASSELRAPRHVFYERLNQVLAAARFDAFVEQQCEPFYAGKQGRPGLAPGIYFRLLFIGYFEGLDSERGIAWRVADSLSLRSFLGLTVAEGTPDHSTISRTRRLIDQETHQAVFGWMLQLLSQQGLVDGRTVGVDSTPLEANAALRSIVRKDSGESYREFLTGLAQASGIETPTQSDLAKIDKNRPKKGSNDDWEHPHDPDAKITKMKDGSTHLAHKVEHVVDLGEGGHGAILAVVRHDANLGDTQTVLDSVTEATRQLHEVRESSPDQAVATIQDVVTDKGYHSNDVLQSFSEAEVRTYCSEPDRGRRHWQGEHGAESQQAVYGNRRRIRGERGKRLLKRRGEILERTFAHCYETGGLRRLHVRGHANIRKRLLIHAAAFNLSLMLRKLLGAGTPRGFQGLLAALRRALLPAVTALRAITLRPQAPQLPFALRLSRFSCLCATTAA